MIQKAQGKHDFPKAQGKHDFPPLQHVLKLNEF